MIGLSEMLDGKTKLYEYDSIGHKQHAVGRAGQVAAVLLLFAGIVDAFLFGILFVLFGLIGAFAEYRADKDDYRKHAP